jgi:hypothetical protein
LISMVNNLYQSRKSVSFNILDLLNPNGFASLVTYFILVSCLAYASTVKMEEIHASETSVEFQQTTGGYISEDRTLQMVLYSYLEICPILVLF